jgi:hypothetical protein
MDLETIRKVSVNHLRALEQIARDAGLPFLEVSDEMLAKMPSSDIDRLSKNLTVILRTPH